MEPVEPRPFVPKSRFGINRIGIWIAGTALFASIALIIQKDGVAGIGISICLAVIAGLVRLLPSEV